MKRKTLQECLSIACKNNTPERHPQFYNYIHYTMIIQRNKILGWGTNMAGPAKYGYKSYMKIHSEYVAYRKAKHLLRTDDSFEVVNIRLNKLNAFKISRPCNCCIGYLKLAGCSKVHFTTAVGFSTLIF